MPKVITRDIIFQTEPNSTKNIKEYFNELKSKKVVIEEEEEKKDNELTLEEQAEQ